MDENYWSRMIPEAEDCSNGLVPRGVESESGEHWIKIADDVISMPKYFFRFHKKKLYEYLNACLKDGSLRAAVQFPFNTVSINPGVCEFKGWDFWRLNQKNFLMDVHFELNLMTETRHRKWQGYIELWCSFGGEKFFFSIEGMGRKDDIPDHKDLVRLSAFLVPYFHGYEIDGECEKLWSIYRPEALMNPKARDAEDLARRNGLTVQYLPVYKDQGVGSILFFAEGKLLVREDKDRILDEPGMEEERKKDEERNPPEEVVIPANTIVVNTNRILKEHSAYGIFHEIFHYEFHYLFFRLQQLGNNDIRKMKTKEILVNPEDKITDPLYWMEKQANRGAYGLLLPLVWMQAEVAKKSKGITKYRHAGDLFEKVGQKICYEHGIANYRMRARLIQMGHIEAKGSLNWLPGRIHLEPFAFDVKSCQRIEETFIIGKFEAGRLYETNEKYRDLFNTGKFVYVDGHIARKDSRFVKESNGQYMLTPWGNEHVDKCCLRFERVYIQTGVGQYLFGRLNYDADYVAKTLFYLGDNGNQELLNEMEAEQKYADDFPAEFAEGLKQLMERAGVTVEQMAEKLSMETRTFQRWMANKDKRYSEDFVMMATLILELPDWISDLLLDRAGLALSNKNPRHLAFQWIRRAMWKDGVEKANEYLRQRKFKPLHI